MVAFSVIVDAEAAVRCYKKLHVAVVCYTIRHGLLLDCHLSRYHGYLGYISRVVVTGAVAAADRTWLDTNYCC